MAIVRNIGVTAQSELSFDDACRVAVAEAAKTLRGIVLFRLARRIHDADLYDRRSDGRVYPWRICA